MLKKSLAVWIPALVVLLFVTAPAAAQNQLNGRYRVVDGETGEDAPDEHGRILPPHAAFSACQPTISFRQSTA